MKHHEFSHTTVHHHKDGSHTMKHHHQSNPEKDMEYAVPGHDEMMDGMQSNLAPQGGAEEAQEAGAAGGMGAGGAV